MIHENRELCYSCVVVFVDCVVVGVVVVVVVVVSRELNVPFMSVFYFHFFQLIF